MHTIINMTPTVTHITRSTTAHALLLAESIVAMPDAVEVVIAVVYIDTLNGNVICINIKLLNASYAAIVSFQYTYTSNTCPHHIP